MSNKVKPWHRRKPRQDNKKNKPLRIGNEKLVPLQADEYQEDRFPRDNFDDPDMEDEFPR